MKRFLAIGCWLLCAGSAVPLLSSAQITVNLKGLLKKKADAVTSTNSTASTATGTASTAGTAASGSSSTSGAGGSAATKADTVVTLKTYANYDFVPGEKIIFEDHFADDQDGEFPAHWKLNSGQAILNKVGGTAAFFLTEGNYVRV